MQYSKLRIEKKNNPGISYVTIHGKNMFSKKCRISPGVLDG